MFWDVLYQHNDDSIVRHQRKWAGTKHEARLKAESELIALGVYSFTIISITPTDTDLI